ncbi:polyprenyl synthetase family protein [Aquirufa nivalisilvae]|uniref:polyprenyl synthetase family protein n=1 Tax=Aquirufa nivalisilvae TaxID=2516557 RepID=UPI0022A9B475|nr:polyprenyl synthetase family protein [Aquirufa nivalisilvae]MCZ2479958.1 polyprenyl synthetase family protein [Aquirufa nivalisilvae]MCZ2481952.1 polyprenyl synthetase family protein [Aquirufa nivalisilvae]
MTKEFLQVLEIEIARMEQGKQPVELYEPIQYLMALGGKRIRPVMCLMAYSLFRDDWKSQVKPALSIEVFHNFTLMHDDIMDKAPLRRGKQTVHEKWNDNIAILSGDVMLVEAYQFLNQIEGLSLVQFQHLLERFSRTAAEVCEGQQWDMNFEERNDVQLAEYIEMIRLKTSVLVGFSMEMGGLLAQVELDIANQLYQIGEFVGLGFQLKDDLLDVYGDPEKFGKQVGGDILANKKTYLLIRSLELAQGETQQKLSYWLNQKQFNATEKVKAVTEIYTQLGLREEVEMQIQSYFDRAFAGMEALNLPQEKKNTLLRFMAGLVDREV